MTVSCGWLRNEQKQVIKVHFSANPYCGLTLTPFAVAFPHSSMRFLPVCVVSGYGYAFFFKKKAYLDLKRENATDSNLIQLESLLL